MAVLLWMTEKATDFTRVTIEQYTDSDAWPTWAILKEHIENHFWINILKVEAYKKILALWQGDLPIEVYMQQFNLLQLDAGLELGITLQLYKKSIDYQIYLQICLHHPTVKETLEKWEDAALEIGKMFHRMQLEQSRTGFVPQHQP